jgi:hypothetical protein
MAKPVDLQGKAILKLTSTQQKQRRRIIAWIRKALRRG